MEKSSTAGSYSVQQSLRTPTTDVGGPESTEDHTIRGEYTW